MNLRRASLLVLALLALAALLWWVDLDRLMAWMDELAAYPAAGPVFVGVYALAALLLIPGSALTLAGGILFGGFWGMIWVSLGANLGALVSFSVSRWLARERLARFVEKRPILSALDRAVGKEGWRAVLLTRLSPVFPFSLQNYAYGLTTVSPGGYVAGTLLGMIPGTALYVMLAASGAQGLQSASSEAGDGLKLGLQVLGLLATVVVTLLITRRAKEELSSVMEEGVE